MKNNVSQLLNLGEKVAIVTRAATGPGAATVKLLSEHGARVVINHLPGQKKLASTAVRARSGEAVCVSGDVTRFESCENTVQATLDDCGRVDILVNSAGINGPRADHDLEALNSEGFIGICSVNAMGAPPPGVSTHSATTTGPFS